MILKVLDFVSSCSCHIDRVLALYHKTVGSIPCKVIPKTFKIVLFGTQCRLFKLNSH